MFLREPPRDEDLAALYARDVAEDGYVANLTCLWGWRPDVFEAFTDLRTLLAERTALSAGERALLVCAATATLGDSYCALTFGTRLADATDPLTAAAVLRREDAPGLTARDKALAAWAAKIVRAPSATTAADVDRLRAAGLSEREIFDATVLVAFRIAFSTVNDALGAQPDAQLAAAAPPPVREAVTFGRPAAEKPSRKP